MGGEDEAGGADMGAQANHPCAGNDADEASPEPALALEPVTAPSTDGAAGPSADIATDITESVADVPSPVASAVDNAEFIKSRELVRRPPLPEPGLYDCCPHKLRRPRRPLTSNDDEAIAPVPEPPPREDGRFASPDTHLIKSAEAFAALDAWVEVMPPRKKAR